jgi:hypothetical protein
VLGHVQGAGVLRLVRFVVFVLVMIGVPSIYSGLGLRLMDAWLCIVFES